MTTISLLLAMCEFVMMANEVFIKLEEATSDFKEEAILIDEIKCALMNGICLNDFEGEDVIIQEDGRGYIIYYKGQEIAIEVEDKMIVDLKYY